jgi:hypothetical protein
VNVNQNVVLVAILVVTIVVITIAVVVVKNVLGGNSGRIRIAAINAAISIYLI